MEYRVAKNIRGRSLSSLITERITEGSGIGSAIGRSVTQKLKATGTGIIEKFDPLNMVKFATGGSRLAPAVLGRITGRSQSSIQYFAGDRQSTERRSYTPLSRALPKSNFGGSSLNILNEILNFLRESYNKDVQRKETEKSFVEEKEVEEQRRHKEFIEVLKTYTALPSYAAPLAGKPEEKKDPTGGILDTVKKMIAAAVEGIKGLLTGMLSMIGKMIQSAIGKALAVLDWVKELKWLKGIFSISSLMSLLAKTYPIFKFLIRFAGPIALLSGLIAAGKAGLNYIAENMPDNKAKSPQEALNILQSGSFRDIQSEGGYEKLANTVRTGKQQATSALEAYYDNPDDTATQKLIGRLGGLDKVKEIANSPELDLSKIPSYEEVYGRLGSRAPTLSQYTRERTGPRREAAERDWNRLYGDNYDPITGLRKDIAENQGPFANVYGVEGVDYTAPPPIQFEQVDPNINVGKPPSRSLSIPISESIPVSERTLYQLTPLPVDSQVNALSKVLDDMQLDKSGSSNTPIINSNTRNVPLPRKPISSSATTRDNTLIFQRAIESNRARY